MTKYSLSPALLKPLTIDNSGNIFVSHKIISTVQTCITAPASEIEVQAENLRKVYDGQKNSSRIKINYDYPSVLDAYTIKYLPRNTLVPKLGLLCCAYHPKMLLNEKRLNILDLASGTGAIPLGLLDLFQNPSLNHIKCDIYALDASASALAKQKNLVQSFGLGGSTHSFAQVDLADPSTYENLLTERAPFDLIFSANVLSELKPEHRSNILAIIRDNLKDDGICIIAESQNMPAKTACAYLTQQASEYGLNIFYPCPPDIDCKNSDCWKWFNHTFMCGDIMVDDVRFGVTKTHIVFWRIIVKRHLSIYQYLKGHDNKLNWGITRYSPKGKCNEFCTGVGQYEATISPQLPRPQGQDPWSHVIGVSDDDKQIKTTWNPIDGFRGCSCDLERLDEATPN